MFTKATLLSIHYIIYLFIFLKRESGAERREDVWCGERKTESTGSVFCLCFLGIHLEYKEYYRFYSCLRALSIIFCESIVLIFSPPRSSWTELNTQGSLLHLHAPSLKPPRSRSLLPMFCVNEEAVIVRGESWRGDVISTPRWRPLFLLCSASFHRPETENSRLHFLGQRSEVGGGGWGVTGAQEDTVRKWLVLFTVISASAALFYLHQISGCFVVVMWQQLLTVRHLQFWFWKLSRIRLTRFATKSYGAQKKKRCVWWSSQSW